MGRHSSDEQGPFYRSLIGWFLPWFLIAGVVGVAVWVLVNAIGGEEIAPPVADLSPSPSVSSASPSPTPIPTETAAVVASPEPTAEPDKKRDRKKKKAKQVALITDGMNVQVLNGTSDTSVDDEVAERLSRLGFGIEAIDDASRSYPKTTVFWSYPEAKKAAKALAARMDWVAEPKPDNLSATVALHVVVGADEL